LRGASRGAAKNLGSKQKRGPKAPSLYEKQEMKEKRRILDFLFSNCLWKNGNLIPNYRKPFDILALTNAGYQKRKATSRVKSGLSEIWLPGRDSNPRPIGYKCPDISARLGLSHHPRQADVGRCRGLLVGVLNL